MKVIVNGEEGELPPAISIADLLERLCIRTKGIAVERNLQIVPRSEYPKCRLSEGDRVEIVTLVGGG